MSKLTDLVHNHYDAINANDLDRALAGFHENVVTETPDGTLHGVAAFRALGEAFQTAVPDQKMTIRQIYETGRSVIVEGDYAGTHSGPLTGPQGTIPPTGRPFSFAFADIFTLEDGNVVRHAIYWDNASFMAQLGLMGSPEPAAV